MLFTFIAATACAGKPTQAVTNPTTGQAETAKPAADEVIVAKVYGDSITEKQVLVAINQLAQRKQMPPQQMQQKDILLFTEAVDTLVNMSLLKNEAKAQKLTTDKAKVEETYQGIVKGFPNEAEFKKTLNAQGMTDASLHTAIEENLLNQQVVDAATKNVPAPAPADIQKFYDGNPQYFAKPERVHAAHILLRIPAAATPEKKAELKQRLEGIRADIESKKITFAEAAAKNSEDPTNAGKGGDLGFFPRGQMVKPFDEAAFTTKPGNLSGIIETQFGYHLINVIELQAAGKATLDESKQNIQTFLVNQAKQAAVEKYIEGLRAKTTVELVISAEQWKQRRAGK
jgi:peptidyl-prolyl cis-trans isomerase C